MPESFLLIEITCYESLYNGRLAAPLRMGTVKIRRHSDGNYAINTLRYVYIYTIRNEYARINYCYALRRKEPIYVYVYVCTSRRNESLCSALL